MANCDSPFSFWSSTSPRKPVQYHCNNTASARILDRTSNAAKTPFPLDKPPSYTCDSNKSLNVSNKTTNDSNKSLNVSNKTTNDSNKKEPCCQHAQQVKTSAISGKVSRGGGFKGVTQKINHKVIPVKSLVNNSGPEKALVSTQYGKTCNDCKKYEADKAKPIEKLIAETRINAKLCAECECHAKAREAHYLKPKGELNSEEKLPAPPADNCCTEDCVGKRVYNKPPASSLRKKKIPTAVRLMDWPWYWSRYFPIAASRVAKRIIQAKVDAEKAKTQSTTCGRI